MIATFRNLNSSSEVSVETARGNFKFRPAEVAYSKPAKFLEGRAMVDRVPASTNIAGSRDEQDYPVAATDRDGNVWVAYVQFSPNPKFLGVRGQLRGPEPANFDDLTEPTKGDQIMLARYSRGAWAESLPVSDAGGDLYKPAVAVDGSNRVWVFWSRNQGDNFNLMARAMNGGRPIRLTTDRGPDVVPVATTDARGSVWVAWQAARNGRFEIHAAQQAGDKFSAELVVASSAGNEWNPAIAASPPTIKVKLVGTAPFAKVHIIRDNKYVYTVEPKKELVEFTWRDAEPEAGKQSYYYVRGEQQDGEIVWASPMWVTYRGR